jgi:hypothetical protein
MWIREGERDIKERKGRGKGRRKGRGGKGEEKGEREMERDRGVIEKIPI